MKVDDVIYATVIRVYPTYAILLLPNHSTGLLHISEISHGYVRNFTRYVKVGNIYRVKVKEVKENQSSIKLSIKALASKQRRLGYNKELLEETSDFRALKAHLNTWIKGEEI